MSEKRKTNASPTVNVPPRVEPFLQVIGRMARQQGVSAYAVGGCVRDWLLGRSATVDLDVSVEGDGIVFARRAAAVLGARLRSHEQFGTATLVIERIPLRIDVVSCRKERYPEPAAYPKVAAGRLRDDLFRRDFTVNAMAMAISPGEFGQLIDPFGGLRDLAARRLRILHARSFQDDPSRILRAARFAERYGLAVELRTLRCLREAVGAGMLERLNRGRLRKELTQMAEESHPLACLELLCRWLRTRSRPPVRAAKPAAP